MPSPIVADREKGKYHVGRGAKSEEGRTGKKGEGHTLSNVVGRLTGKVKATCGTIMACVCVCVCDL